MNGDEVIQAILATRDGREAAGEALDYLGAAHEFLDRCGVRPTPDAVAQLVGPFLHCLKIISERGYDQDGASWREQGWRGQLFEVMKRARRMEFFAWKRRDPRKAIGSAEDIVNYGAFFMRLVWENPNNTWGEFGEPQ